jgi:hypothetical protein
MPYDGIGEFLLSHHMAKHVGSMSKQSFDQLKAYTDAVVENLSSKNAHSDHNRRHNYPGNQGAQDLYASMLRFLRGASRVPLVLGEDGRGDRGEVQPFR